MAVDEHDKLATMLEQILTRYEGAEDDPVWQEAKRTLESMKPKPLFLFCPKCKFLHVDEGEWASRSHRTHLCAECGHKWRPHAYPTVGIAFPEMDARETMGFLRFYAAWSRRFAQQNPNASEAQLQYLQKILGEGWTASRDFWMANAPKARVVKSPKSAKVEDEEPGIEFDGASDEEVDPEIAKHVQEGKLTWEDVDGLGFDPRVYVPYGLQPPGQEPVAAAQEHEGDIASTLGIEFDDDVGDYDEETGISF